jgi:subtilisin family serine protease
MHAGNDIYSTAMGGGYKRLSGTSMATPVVAGVAALMVARNPAIMPRQIITSLMKGVDANSAAKSTTMSGGKISAYKALVSSMRDVYVSSFPSEAKVPLDGSSKLALTFSGLLKDPVRIL